MNKRELIDLCDRFDQPNHGLVIDLRTRLNRYLRDHRDELQNNPQFARLYPHPRGRRAQVPVLRTPSPEHHSNNGDDFGNIPDQEPQNNEDDDGSARHSEAPSDHNANRTNTHRSLSDISNDDEPPAPQDSSRKSSPFGTFFLLKDRHYYLPPPPITIPASFKTLYLAPRLG